jgi:hypothetical protein
MTEPNSVAQRVIERFPEHRVTVRWMMEGDPGFREICVDYYETHQAFRYWQARVKCAGPEDPLEEVAAQYRELLLELEAEILAALREGADSVEPELSE